MLKVVYKDALEYEFRKNNISFELEKKFEIKYKDVILKHKFYADFVVYDEIILEVKTAKTIADGPIAQTLKYKNLFGNKLGININLKNRSLEHQWVIV